MLLNWYGIDVSKEEIAMEIPKGGRGMNPNDAFLGNPFTEKAYGVFEQPILNMIEQYVPNSAVNLTGKDLEELLTYIDMGFPIQIWCTISMTEPVYRVSWRDTSGELFYWPENEHSVVLVGYDEGSVYINDPMEGKMVSYPIEKLKKRYDQLGKKAVLIDRPVLRLEVKKTVNSIIEREGISYLPLRDICESLNLTVVWHENMKMIEIVPEGMKGIFIGKEGIKFGENTIALEYSLMEYDDYTYISLNDLEKFIKHDIVKNDETGISEMKMLGLESKIIPFLN